jgi:hypothetical protein
MQRQCHVETATGRLKTFDRKELGAITDSNESMPRVRPAGNILPVGEESLVSPVVLQTLCVILEGF